MIDFYHHFERVILKEGSFIHIPGEGWRNHLGEPAAVSVSLAATGVGSCTWTWNATTSSWDGPAKHCGPGCTCDSTPGIGGGKMKDGTIYTAPCIGIGG